MIYIVKPNKSVLCPFLQPKEKDEKKQLLLCVIALLSVGFFGVYDVRARLARRHANLVCGADTR